MMQKQNPWGAGSLVGHRMVDDDLISKNAAPYPVPADIRSKPGYKVSNAASKTGALGMSAGAFGMWGDVPHSGKLLAASVPVAFAGTAGRRHAIKSGPVSKAVTLDDIHAQQHKVRRDTAGVIGGGYVAAASNAGRRANNAIEGLHVIRSAVAHGATDINEQRVKAQAKANLKEQARFVADPLVRRGNHPQTRIEGKKLHFTGETARGAGRISESARRARVVHGGAARLATHAGLIGGGALAAGGTAGIIRHGRKVRNLQSQYQSQVSKAYNDDPEINRQRHLGQLTAGLGVAGVGAVGLGARGIQRDTKKFTSLKTKTRVPSAAKEGEQPSKERVPTPEAKILRGEFPHRAAHVTGRNAALVGAGAAALAGSGAVAHHARSSRTSRRWK